MADSFLGWNCSSTLRILRVLSLSWFKKPALCMTQGPNRPVRPVAGSDTRCPTHLELNQSQQLLVGQHVELVSCGNSVNHTFLLSLWVSLLESWFVGPDGHAFLTSKPLSPVEGKHTMGCRHDTFSSRARHIMLLGHVPFGLRKRSVAFG